MKYVKKFENFRINEEEVPYNFEIGDSKGKILWSDQEIKDLQDIGSDYISDNIAIIEYKDLKVTIEKIPGRDSFKQKGSYTDQLGPQWQRYGWGSGKEFGYKITTNQRVSRLYSDEFRYSSWRDTLNNIDYIFKSHKKAISGIKEGFKNPFKSDKVSYKSKYVNAKGNFTKDEIMILKTIDCLRDAGFDCQDASGSITDGADVWTISGIALKPDYDKKSLRIQRLKDLKVYGEVGFSSPEKMTEEVEKILSNIV